MSLNLWVYVQYVCMNVLFQTGKLSAAKLFGAFGFPVPVATEVKVSRTHRVKLRNCVNFNVCM